VWQWEEGRGAPDTATVAKLEELFDLDKGTLARLLGYQPPDGEPPISVLEAVSADPHLDDSGRDLLTSVYRWLIHNRQVKR